MFLLPSQNMHDFRLIRPGSDVKKVLLYFSDCKQYKICDDINNINNIGKFELKIGNAGFVTSSPTHWLELREE